MWSIDENTCNFDFIITEIADPPPTGMFSLSKSILTPTGVRRYVEIVITTGEDASSLPICLNTLRVRTDGFLVFCQDLIGTMGPAPVYGDKCDSRLEILLRLKIK